MGRIVELLEEKNRCLEKFYRMNETEIMNFSVGNFDNLETFYESRDGILEMIKRVDKMIEEDNGSTNPEDYDNASKKKVLAALDYKNELVTRILSQDLQILSFIEQAKSKIIKDLSAVRSARKAMNGYQSGMAAEPKLDEEI